MGKKERIKAGLANFNTYLSGLVNSLIAIIGFTFSTASGIIKCPAWISITSFCSIFLVLAGIYLAQKTMTKLQDELGGL